PVIEPAVVAGAPDHPAELKHAENPSAAPGNVAEALALEHSLQGEQPHEEKKTAEEQKLSEEKVQKEHAQAEAVSASPMQGQGDQAVSQEQHVPAAPVQEQQIQAAAQQVPETPVQVPVGPAAPAEPALQSQEPTAMPTEESVPAQQAQEQGQEVGMPVEKTPDEVAIEQESTEEKSFGIDTIDLEEPQGNWLFKRIWWERAQERYEKVRNLVDELADFRMEFFVKRTELDKNVLAPFYVSLGFGKGEMQEILRQLLERIEKIRAQEEALTEGERSFLADLEGEQKVLEELNIGIEIVNKLDQDIDNAIAGLMEHINKMRSYERDAWEAFKEIARVLSDKKARELFYRIETDWRNVKDLHRYLEHDFTAHFSQVSGRLQQEITRIQKMLAGLAEKGIVFKEQADRLDMLEQQKAEQAAAPAQELEPETVKKVTKKGWMNIITDPLVSVGSMLWNTVSYPFVAVYRMMFGKPKAIAAKKFDMEAVQATENQQLDNADQQMSEENAHGQ
ncbi:MAG TPA: hypothetical protein VEK38_01335, partial [Candidatus Bathyarchaeia archaeon]|nr:hypothetical protein [Candidatus Bathyarchaeia archaeon]